VPRRRRLRLVLALVGGALAVLCLGGGGIAYVLYDRATAPDRSAPDVVVDNYLRAYLVDRNDTKAQLYVCGDSSQFAELRALRADLRAREQQFKTTFTISWGSLAVRADGASADVSVTLIISTAVDGVIQSDRQPWHFVTQLGKDWRVCSAGRAG
jgi:hypothetical protein